MYFTELWHAQAPRSTLRDLPPRVPWSMYFAGPLLVAARGAAVHVFYETLACPGARSMYITRH